MGSQPIHEYSVAANDTTGSRSLRESFAGRRLDVLVFTSTNICSIQSQGLQSWR